MTNYLKEISQYNIRQAKPRPSKCALPVIDMQRYFQSIASPILDKNRYNAFHGTGSEAISSLSILAIYRAVLQKFKMPGCCGFDRWGNRLYFSICLSMISRKIDKERTE
jgi:hypothetical protein